MGKSERSSAETKANHISSRQKENRSGTKGTVGEGESGEEEIGGVGPREPAASMLQDFVLEVNRSTKFLPVLRRRESDQFALDSTSLPHFRKCPNR
jgi:hypothetical protein